MWERTEIKINRRDKVLFEQIDWLEVKAFDQCYVHLKKGYYPQILKTNENIGKLMLSIVNAGVPSKEIEKLVVVK